MPLVMEVPVMMEGVEGMNKMLERKEGVRAKEAGGEDVGVDCVEGEKLESECGRGCFFQRFISGGGSEKVSEWMTQAPRLHDRRELLGRAGQCVGAWMVGTVGRRKEL